MTRMTGSMTAADLERLPGDGRYELIRGEPVPMAPVGFEHGSVVVNLVSLLRAFVEERGLGRVLVEVGFVLQRDPDTLRGPDVSFLSTESLARRSPREGFVLGPPDLAVEVVSPGEAAMDVEAKVQEYLGAGTRLVWVVHPRTRTVTAYRADGSARVVRDAEALDGADVLPGLSAPLALVFAG